MSEMRFKRVNLVKNINNQNKINVSIVEAIYQITREGNTIKDFLDYKEQIVLSNKIETTLREYLEYLKGV